MLPPQSPSVAMSDGDVPLTPYADDITPSPPSTRCGTAPCGAIRPHRPPVNYSPVTRRLYNRDPKVTAVSADTASPSDCRSGLGSSDALSVCHHRVHRLPMPEHRPALRGTPFAITERGYRLLLRKALSATTGNTVCH